MTDAKPTENEQTKVEEKPKTKIVLMKKGDYQVHILLEEIKNWEQKTDKNPPYPVVKLTCFDKSLMLLLITLHRYLQHTIYMNSWYSSIMLVCFPLSI